MRTGILELKPLLDFQVKKRQQRVMMILESKQIPYEAIDITEAGKEVDKEFMLKNAKPRGDSKYILSPQIFNEEVYCGVSL
jgi:glutaredoxin